MTFPLLMVLIALCYFDIKYRLILNIVTLPLIICGFLVTGNWLWAGLMFIVLLPFYTTKNFAGGDIKLMMMLASFLGSEAFWILTVSLFILVCYRYFSVKPVPYAPFVLLAFLINLL